MLFEAVDTLPPPPLQQLVSAVLSLFFFLPTLQHEEAHHTVQVDVLSLPLQKGCSFGEAVQDLVDHLRPRATHCGGQQQSQHRGRQQPDRPHHLLL